MLDRLVFRVAGAFGLDQCLSIVRVRYWLSSGEVRAVWHEVYLRCRVL